MTIAARLLDAQRKVQSLPLDGRSPQYRYTTAEGLIETAREALHGAGLVLVPGTVGVSIQPLSGAQESTDTRTGEVRSTPTAPVAVVLATYALREAEGPDSVALQAASAAGIPIDRRGVPEVARAVAAARTYALRDLLRDLLLAPKGEENGNSELEPSAPRPQPAKPVASAPAAAPVAKPVAAPAKPAAPAAKPAAPAAKPAVRVVAGAAKDAAFAFGANAKPSQGPDMSQQELEDSLVNAGWPAAWAAELALAPDGETAPASAALDVHKQLNEAHGVEATRAAWLAACGAGVDARSICLGQQPITWGQVRALALQRRKEITQ